jgi:hypothetical protein
MEKIMSSVLSTKVGRSIVAIGCVALLPLFSARVVNTQGISASANPPKPNTVADINALRQQVVALERRVVELEKKKVELAKEESDDEARVKKLEQRLASLEKTPENRNASTKAETGGPEAFTTVTAPFVVVDRAGKPLMRVHEEEEGFSRGIYIYNGDAKVVAHVGAMGDGGGRIYVTRPAALPMALMAAPVDGSASFELSANGKKSLVIDKQSLVYYNDAHTPIAVFGSKDRSKGYLELNDSAGAKMVEAGSLATHKGYVLASPYQASVSPQGDPSVLKGGGKQ